MVSCPGQHLHPRPQSPCSPAKELLRKPLKPCPRRASRSAVQSRPLAKPHVTPSKALKRKYVVERTYIWYKLYVLPEEHNTSYI